MNKSAGFSLVVGLGKTGLSCIRYLSEKKLPVAVADTRENPPELIELKKQFPAITVYLGELPQDIFLKAREIIVSPGLSLQTPAIAKAMQAGVSVIGDIELFARVVKAPVIGITGTNAKGTVTTLVGDMLAKAGHQVLVGGNIGTPALDLLQEKTPDYYVLELSSFQLETTHSLQLAAAAILNVSEDHLDRHGAMANYIAAKQRIYRACQTAVYNRDDSATTPPLTTPHKISFGSSVPAAGEFGLLTLDNATWLSLGNQPLLNTVELRIKGSHNWANALAALAIGSALKLPMPPMLQALCAFKGLPHRCEWILEKDNIAWYDDSKGTNVGSTLAAIQGLGNTISGKIILIAGGLSKGADFAPLAAPVRQYVRHVILMGKDAPLIAKALQAITSDISYVKNLTEAVLCAKKIAQAGDAVLLSPACASWDMFRNYEERGELFKAAVKEIYREK